MGLALANRRKFYFLAKRYCIIGIPHSGLRGTLAVAENKNWEWRDQSGLAASSFGLAFPRSLEWLAGEHRESRAWTICRKPQERGKGSSQRKASNRSRPSSSLDIALLDH